MALPVLVPADEHGSDLRALGLALRIAAVTNTDVRLLSVVADPEQVGRARHALGSALSRFPDQDVNLTVVVAESVPDGIVAAAQGAAHVCMTTAATLLPHEGHFGSVAEEVVRNLERPVILVGPHVNDTVSIEIDRVVASVDGSVASEAVLPSAARFADTLKVPLWVVTVVTNADRRNAEAAAGGELGPLESGYVRRLAERVGKQTGDEIQFEVLHGEDPADSLLDFAAPQGVLAMSTHGRTGMKRVLAGSVTTSVVARAPQPVLVLRPSDVVLGR